MKLGVHIPAWHRLELLEVVLQNLEFVGEELRSEGHDLVTAVAGSPEDEPMIIEICQRPRVHYVSMPNMPLGKKTNAACLKLQQVGGCDGIIGLGSDDLISIHVLRHWIKLLGEGCDYMGVSDLYLLDLQQKLLIHWPGYTNHRAGESIGAGRCLSARLLDEIYWRPFDDDSSVSLDWSLTKKLQNRHFQSTVTSLPAIGGCIVDVKTGFNLNPMPEYGGALTDAHKIMCEFFGDYVTREVFGVRP